MSYRPETKDIILLTYAGSKVLGIDTDESDIDLLGVVIPPKKMREQFFFDWEQLESKEDYFSQFRGLMDQKSVEQTKNGLEGTVMNLDKYMRLSAKCNPTLLAPMFAADHHILRSDTRGELLRSKAKAFLSLKAHKSFIGYAVSQLKRIQGHKRWFDNPPVKPNRKERGLSISHKILNNEQLQAFKTLGAKQMVKLGIKDDLAKEIMAEIQYSKDMENYKRYETWRKNRNPVRAKLEEECSFDTKHAAHLVRLLNVGEEIVKTGEVHIDRTEIDASMLLDIRNGLWTYEELINYSEKKQKEIDDFVKSGESPLPEEPDWPVIEELYLNLLNMWDGR